MTGPAAVSPTSLNPEWDITLTDGTDTLGFVLVNGRGEKEPRAIQRTPFGPRTALKTSQGNSKYDDFELPYTSISQDDWSGGRGKLNLEDDITRYWDGYRMDTTKAGKMIRGPSEHYGIGSWRQWDGIDDQAYEGGYNWRQMLDTFYLGVKFTASANYNTESAIAIIKYYGTPGALIAELRSDNAGNPGAVLKSKTLTYDTLEAAVPIYHEFVWSSAQALVSGTDYWIVFSVTSGTHTEASHWEIACNHGYPGKASTDGSVWVALGVNAPYFRVLEAENELDGVFFEYKGATYFVNKKAAKLYINGDRGAADSNAGALNTLIDATKSWTTNVWAGSVAMITAGPGVGEYRNIVSNTGTVLTVDRDWDTTHTTETEYIITKTDRWTEKTTMSSALANVSGVAVAGETIFFSNLDDTIAMAREYNNGGTWTEESGTWDMIINARDIITTQNADGSFKLWGICNNDSTYAKRPFIFHATVPPYWGDPYKDIGEIAPTDTAWNDRVVPSVTQGLTSGHTVITADAAFTTGIIAVKELDEAVDISNGSFFGVAAYANVTGTNLKMIIDDVGDLEENVTPLKVLASRWYSPTYCYYWNGSDYTTVSMANAIDGLTDTAAAINGMATTHRLFIGYSAPFSSVYYNVTDTNSNASAMSLNYFDGKDYVALTISDGTASGGATLAQDGNVTYNPPDDWKPSIVNNVEAYWLMMTVSAALDSTVSIAEIKLCVINQEMPNLIDGDGNSYDQFALRSTDYLWICGNKPFNQIQVVMGATGNDVVATLSATYFNGNTWASVNITDNTISGGRTLPDNANNTITLSIPYNWKKTTVDGTEGYWLRLTPSADLSGSTTNPSIGMMAYTINVIRQNNMSWNMSTTANTWKWLTFDTSTAYHVPDYSAIKSFGISLNYDYASSVILQMKGGVRLGQYAPDIIELPNCNFATRIISYGSSSGIGTNPYVITDNGIYEVQQENNNSIVKLPIGEMEAISDPDSGHAACVNDVYLWFNLGKKVERYYNNTLEDIGPDLDDGLPAERQGEISSLLSYPGTVYLAIDAGSAGYSSILARSGNGWHEIYRAPYGKSILAMGHQSIPGSTTSRIWFVEGGDLAWIGVSPYPDSDSDYYHTGEGYLITGWYYTGMQTIKKVFDSLTMLLSGNGGDYLYARIEYQTDNDIGWTVITDRFDETFEEISLGNTRPTGRRIRFRIHLIGNTYTSGVIAIATVMDSYGIVPVKYQYTFTAMLTELNGHDVNLEEQEQRALGYSDLAETALAKLDAWVDAAQVLTMNSRYSVYDNKSVLLTAPAHIPAEISSVQQIEKHILNITCHDL